MNNHPNSPPCVVTCLRHFASSMVSDWPTFADAVANPASAWSIDDFADLEVMEAYHNRLEAGYHGGLAPWRDPWHKVIDQRDVAFMLIWLRHRL